MDKKEIAEKLLAYGRTLGVEEAELKKGVRYAWHQMIAGPKKPKVAKAPKTA